MSRLFLIVFFLMVAAGCSDCTMYASGVVKDLRSKTTIEGAVLKRIGESNVTVTTDEDGEFEFEEVEGLSECQQMQVEVAAPGYTTIDLMITNGAYVEIFLDTL